MAQIIRTAAAKRDAAEIWHYISFDSERAANKVIDLDPAFEMLAIMPGMARRRPEFGPEVRAYPVGKYMACYRSIPDGIEVLRVCHGARNLKNLDEDRQ